MHRIILFCASICIFSTCSVLVARAQVPSSGDIVNQETLIKAYTAFEKRNYRECIRLCDNILIRNPAHSEARKLKKKARGAISSGVFKRKLKYYMLGTGAVRRLRKGFTLYGGMYYSSSKYFYQGLGILTSLSYTYVPIRIRFGVAWLITHSGVPDDLGGEGASLQIIADVGWLLFPLVSWFQLYLNIGYAFRGAGLYEDTDRAPPEDYITHRSRSDHFFVFGPSVWLGFHGKSPFSMGLELGYHLGIGSGGAIISMIGLQATMF